MSGTVKRLDGLKTKDSILQAARRLFLRQGYHATGMREIAREAGISPGAVYNHFSSKEEILEELLIRNNLYGTMAEALSRARGGTVAELLENGFAEIMAALQDKTDFPLFVFIDVLEFQGRHIGKLASDALPKLLAFFERFYAMGADRGEMRDVSPVLLLRTFVGMVLSSFIIENLIAALDLGQVRLLPLHVENWEQGMVDILLHGVLKELPDQKGA